MTFKTYFLVINIYQNSPEIQKFKLERVIKQNNNIKIYLKCTFLHWNTKLKSVKINNREVYIIGKIVTNLKNGNTIKNKQFIFKKPISPSPIYVVSQKYRMFLKTHKTSHNES